RFHKQALRPAISGRPALNGERVFAGCEIRTSAEAKRGGDPPICPRADGRVSAALRFCWRPRPPGRGKMGAERVATRAGRGNRGNGEWRSEPARVLALPRAYEPLRRPRQRGD